MVVVLLQVRQGGWAGFSDFKLSFCLMIEKSEHHGVGTSRGKMTLELKFPRDFFASHPASASKLA